jgi:hypothetical protein
VVKAELEIEVDIVLEETNISINLDGKTIEPEEMNA